MKVSILTMFAAVWQMTVRLAPVVEAAGVRGGVQQPAQRTQAALAPEILASDYFLAQLQHDIANRDLLQHF
jgi:hypothetical protein